MSLCSGFAGRPVGGGGVEVVEEVDDGLVVVVVPIVDRLIDGVPEGSDRQWMRPQPDRVGSVDQALSDSTSGPFGQDECRRNGWHAQNGMNDVLIATE